MGNYLAPQKVERLSQLFLQGFSMRAACRMVGCSTNTGWKYYPIDTPPSCPCGLEAGHRGWCRVRYAESPARQAMLGNPPAQLVIDRDATRLLNVAITQDGDFLCLRCSKPHRGILTNCGPRVRRILTAEDVPKYGRFTALCQHCQRELAFKGSMAELLASDLKWSAYAKTAGTPVTLWRLCDEKARTSSQEEDQNRS
jgi:hypothetical protein